MQKNELRNLIEVASGRKKADTVIKNAKIINVFSKEVFQGDIAISGDWIAGIGDYDGEKTYDAKGLYASPGFTDSHIHIESSFLSPEELSRLLVPHGTTTIIADPHEIVNVAGLNGLYYMLKAAKYAAMDIKYMLPSCVPATPFENSGARINAEDMKEAIRHPNILGLGEFMNFPGVIEANDEVLNKILLAKNENKLIDGHSPGLLGKELNAYTAAGILADHECSTKEEMTERIRNGMYVMLRQGSACHDLETLAKYVTEENSRRCVLCSDDRQPKTIFENGHLNHHLKICVDNGIHPLTAIQMASINAAECFQLKDRGAIAPGLRADIVLLQDLEQFDARAVWIKGRLVAENGNYLPKIRKYDISSVRGSIRVRDFSKDRLKMHLRSNRVHAIEIVPGGVLTKKTVETVSIDENGEFVFSPEKDIVKIAVVERHHATGNVACAFLKGYGIRQGAIAVSIAHDSHNIIAAGVSDEQIEHAVKELIEQEGGIVLVKNGKVLERMPNPIAGLMSDQSGEWVDAKLTSIHQKACDELGIHPSVEPVMTLCFMSLAVIPEIKLTDMGLFDVNAFSFIDIEADE